MLSCLEQMDRFCRHTGAVIFDYIGINRWNSDYKNPLYIQQPRQWLKAVKMERQSA
jgi:hypothetical protein